MRAPCSSSRSSASRFRRCARQPPRPLTRTATGGASRRADGAGFRVCVAGGGDRTACIKAQANFLAFIALLAYALEEQGPEVTDQTIARQMVNFPAIGGATPYDPVYSLGNVGPGPFTYIDNFMEIWWDPSRIGNDGDPGYPHYVDQGRRFYEGQWPSTPPAVFVDDGSEQPGRDPDL